MQVILKEDVVGLGDIGELVKVKPGFARNFLIPKGKAIEAGSKKAGLIAHHMKHIQKKKNVLKVECEALAEKLRDSEVKLDLRVTSTGKVFGSVTSRMIAENLSAQKFNIERQRILLKEPIKKIGVHFVDIKLHPEVKTQIKVVVIEKAASQDEEEREALELKAKMESSAAVSDQEAEIDDPPLGEETA